MRGKQASKRKIEPDIKYENLTVAKFINLVMQGGQKTTAQANVYGAFDIIKEKTNKEGVEIFEKAIRNVSPVLEVKSRRIGGANYQIPIEVKGNRKNALALRWIINAARNKKGKPMREKLAQELIDASQQQGEAIKKREDVHRMAEANRAFAHFA
ncbi:30S ribosomal protein S7 [Patescibacteria group bacterium]|nr:30S ribosomal protein S7 [Patescibacteria group bacterium]MBU0963789.1 30S ribosomal protein S7 [Patescibacteria group bacterium]